MMTPRECYNRVLRFQKADFIPNFEFGPMNSSMLDEWRSQGFPAKADFAGYFRLHHYEDFRHIRFDPMPGVDGQGVVEETPSHKITRDNWGRLVEQPKGAGMAEGARHIVRNGIETRGDWEKIKGHFRADEPKRYPDHWDEDNWEQKKARWRRRDHPTILWAPSMIGEVKEIMGFENFCIQLYEDRPLIEEILETRTQLALDILGRGLEETDFDVMHFWEDIAYNSGPILSPTMFDEIAVPRYKRLVDFFRSKGGEIVSVDSDGDITRLLPLWMKAGVNHFWPMEVNAGMDVVALRKQYGHAFSMRGGINKYALLESKAAIERELDRVAPVVQDGGYIPHLDHQIPCGVTFENFCYYVEQKRKLLGIRE
jgi:uroporphyrinogen decarboxylase